MSTANAFIPWLDHWIRQDVVEALSQKLLEVWNSRDGTVNPWGVQKVSPRGSMYGIITYIYLHLIDLFGKYR